MELRNVSNWAIAVYRFRVLAARLPHEPCPFAAIGHCPCLRRHTSRAARWRGAWRGIVVRRAIAACQPYLIPGVRSQWSPRHALTGRVHKECPSVALVAAAGAALVDQAVGPALRVDDRIKIDLEHRSARRTVRRNTRALIAHRADGLDLNRPYSRYSTRSHLKNIDGTSADPKGLHCGISARSHVRCGDRSAKYGGPFSAQVPLFSIIRLRTTLEQGGNRCGFFC